MIEFGSNMGNGIERFGETGIGDNAEKKITHSVLRQNIFKKPLL